MQNRKFFGTAVAVTIYAFCFATVQLTAGEMVYIPWAKYTSSMLTEGGQPQPEYIGPYCLDAVAVTNGEFLQFVLENPQWRRDRIPSIFSDPGYLKHWADATTLPTDDPGIENKPVVNVSWYAANAYCRSLDMRLPTLKEWEAAAAAPLQLEGITDPKAIEAETDRIILDWYQKQSNVLPEVGKTTPNTLQIFDLHGVIWEWVYDFNSKLVTGDNREGTSFNRQLFCGAGAIGAADVTDYATFMREAFRSSLKASYSVSSLGFRCAASIEQTETK